MRKDSPNAYSTSRSLIDRRESVIRAGAAGVALGGGWRRTYTQPAGARVRIAPLRLERDSAA